MYLIGCLINMISNFQSIQTYYIIRLQCEDEKSVDSDQLASLENSIDPDQLIWIYTVF